MSTEVPDPKRWFALAIAALGIFVSSVDATVLNVAIPTIQRDLHTTLPALQWVVSGYALMYATFLIIGGRLADVFGTRRIFMLGFGLFGAGSLLAALATSVPHLVLGEAVVEGMGAAMMMPASLTVISTMFQGRERATAFAAWGATAAVGAGAGPVIGGLLTTHLSWRYAFGINVALTPLAIVAAWFVMPGAHRVGARLRVDLTGALLIASGMFLLVFALGQGSVYGWWTTRQPLTVLGHLLWPASRPLSIVPLLAIAIVVLLSAFWWVEQRRSARGADQIFEFSLLRIPSYRTGMLIGFVIAMGQLGFSLNLVLFIQDALHRTPATTGLWVVPIGTANFVGANAAGRFAQRIGPASTVRLGSIIYVVALASLVPMLTLDATFWRLMPGLALLGFAAGLQHGQLTNVTMSDIPPEWVGVAAGSTSTVRQTGAALGVSIQSALIATQAARSAVHRVSTSSLGASAQADVLRAVRRSGVGVPIPTSLPPQDVGIARHVLDLAAATGARASVLFALVVSVITLVLSFRLPRQPPAATD